MARRSVKRGMTVLFAAGCLCGSPPAQANDAGALVRQMAAEPWHYGGVLRGPVDGRVLIGLDMPAGGGAVHGETMLLTGDRRLIDTGRVSGEVGAYAVPGGRDCILHLVSVPRLRSRVNFLTGARNVPAGWHGRSSGGMPTTRVVKPGSPQRPSTTKAC